MNARLLLLVTVMLTAFIASPPTLRATPDENLVALCARVGNDDAVRQYDSTLRVDLAQVFKALFPNATAAPADDWFKAGVNFRCMNGKVLACYVGANRPCAKMTTARDNAGANEFCRSHPDSDVVPASATGHDTVYSYRCNGGRADVARQILELDERGFAKNLWTVIPDQ